MTADHPAILRRVADLRRFVAEKRAQGLTIALVPTMGALHAGHIALVRDGLARADLVIASIFVNPAQFAPHEDFGAYPRTWAADLEKLSAAGAQAVFYPDAQDMYPAGFSTAITVGGVSAMLEGEHRPQMFGGVATVVTKLLLQVGPDIALFGEKDYQQLQVIRHLVADLNIPVEIIGVPTVRDEAGLALSSRNAYLSAEERVIATSLNKILFTMAERIRGGKGFDTVLRWGREEAVKSGFGPVDYIDLRDADTLQPVADGFTGKMRILAAMRVGTTRLIDNVPV